MGIAEEDRRALSALDVKVTAHFDSLQEAARELSRRYSSPSIDLPLVDWKTDREIGKRHVPRFLFRGESGIYQSTISTRARLERQFSGEQWTAHRERVTELLLYCAETLRRLMPDPDPHDAIGFLQHYGLPTATVDVSSSFDVAAYFGSFGAVGRVKLLGVFPVEPLIEHRRRLVDLRGGLGKRADGQQAFVIFQAVEDDYKSARTCGSLGIEWISYVLSERDRAIYNASKGYLSEVTDPFMGLLPLLVREFERAQGPIQRAIRAEGIDRIPEIPLLLNEQGHVVLEPKPGQAVFRVMNSRVLTQLTLA